MGHLCSNFLMASATTTLINLTPAPRGRKIVCKHVIFFDHGSAGYLTYLGVPHLHANRPSITVTVAEIYNGNQAKHRMYTRGSCTSEYFLATTTCFEYFMCAKILFSSRSRTTTFIVTYTLLYSYASGINYKLKNNISDTPISAKNTSTEPVAL